MQEEREIKHFARQDLGRDLARQRQILGQLAALDLRQDTDGAQRMLVHRIDMIHVVLGLPDDAAEFGNEAPQHAGLVHFTQRLLGRLHVAEERHEEMIGFFIGAQIAVDQLQALMHQAKGARVNVETAGLGLAEELDQPRRALVEGVLVGNRQATALGAQPVRCRRWSARAAPPGGAFETVRLERGAQHPGQHADRFGDQKVMLHEAFHGEIAVAVAVTHAARDFRLQVEGEAILRPARRNMEMRPHLPQKSLGAGEPDLLFIGDQAAIHELGEAFDSVEIFGDPEQGVQIAQAPLAVLDVGLEQIARIAGALVARVAFAQLGGDEFAFAVGHDLVPEALAQDAEQCLVAP